MLTLIFKPLTIFMKRIQKLALFAAGFLVLYALFGFGILPRLVRPKLLEAVSKYTGL